MRLKSPDTYPRPDVAVTRWRREESRTRTRIGYVSLLFPSVALSVRDASVHRFESNGDARFWLTMPSRGYTDTEGRSQAFALFWFSRATHEHITDCVLAQLKARAPDLFGQIPEREAVA